MTKALRAIKIFLTLVAVAAVAFAGGFFLFARGIAKTSVQPVSAEGVVALTGGKDRIGQAFAVLANGQAKRLLITGVHPSTKAHELQRLVPRGEEYFPCCVDLGRTALDTRGNAMETSEWVAKHGFTSLIVVTSTYHMPRTLIEFSRAMPDVKLIPFGVVSSNVKVEKWWAHSSTRRLLASEYVKYLNALSRCTLGRLFGEPGESAN